MRHSCCPNNCFSCPAWKYNYSRPTMPETFSCMFLILANLPSIFFQRNVMRLTINITCKIFSGPSQSKQRLLYLTSLAWVHGNCFLIDANSQERCNLLCSYDFFQNSRICCDENQSMDRICFKTKSTVARHCFCYIDKE
ncbi:unannotated protein [freshwater metagenome]|uniref:Unannotated protein n=1 Tax=freshwater metagenome TaxID=449393 RepID=A0A6J6AD84_9ZZZZ